MTVKLQNIAAKALRGCYEQMRQALPRSDAVAMDETAAKEANEKARLRTAATKQFTLFHIAETRAADVAKKLLGKDVSGIVTSDRYGGYDWINKQQLCWAHLLRDFQSLIDAGGKAKTIGRRLKECAQQLFHHWHRFRDGKVVRDTMGRNIRKLWRPVYETLEEGTLKLSGEPMRNVSAFRTHTVRRPMKPLYATTNTTTQRKCYRLGRTQQNHLRAQDTPSWVIFALAPAKKMSSS